MDIIAGVKHRCYKTFNIPNFKHGSAFALWMQMCKRYEESYVRNTYDSMTFEKIM